MTTDDPWDFYPCRVDDAPASISLTTRFQDGARPKELDTLYVAGVHLEDAGEQGMGTAAEGELIYAAEEEFREKLTPQGFTQVGRLRNKGSWQVSFYAATGKETEFHGLLAITLATTGREVWTHIAADPTWNYYDTFLSPDEERRQWMSNRNLVEALEAKDDPLTTPRPVDHSTRFPNLTSATAFKTASESLGFQTTLTEPTGDTDADPVYQVKAEREDPVNLTHIHGVVMELTDLATSHGGEYEGWGCHAPVSTP